MNHNVAEATGLRRRHYKVSAASRLTVYARDDYTCRWCHAKAERVEPYRVWRRHLGGLVPVLTDDVLTVDHVKPRVLGGPDAQPNLMTLCIRCNDFKGSYPWADAPQQVRWFA